MRHFTAAETMARSNNPARLDRQFYFQIGAACERAHQYKRAEDYLQKCIDMGPDDAEALNYLGFMWADRGEHLPKARAYIEKACKLEPNNAAYLDSLGWVLFKLNQPQAALPWLVKAVELSPEPDATILDHLGDVYLSLRQLGKAMENWKKSLAVEPNDEVKKKLQAGGRRRHLISPCPRSSPNITPSRKPAPSSPTSASGSTAWTNAPTA